MGFTSWLRNRKRPASPRPRQTFRPALEALEDRCVPSTLTVANNNDSGVGSLRYEIAQAKSSDTIVFDKSLDGGTITLSSGELDVTKNVTIQGPSADLLTVSGGGGSRVFEIGSKAKVTLSGLTISNGSAPGINGGPELGGGVFNSGALTVSGCTLSGNRAVYGGGIFNSGTLTVGGCTVSGNSAFEGGGLFNTGTLAVNGCTIGAAAGSALSGNGAVEGAGIYNSGKATVSNSNLTGNNATAGDQGSGEGGGIYNIGSKMTVSNCALSNNTAGDPGGGIYNGAKAGALTVRDSIFSGNVPDNIYGYYTDGGGNTFS